MQHHGKAEMVDEEKKEKGKTKRYSRLIYMYLLGHQKPSFTSSDVSSSMKFFDFFRKQMII